MTRCVCVCDVWKVLVVERQPLEPLYYYYFNSKGLWMLRQETFHEDYGRREEGGEHNARQRLETFETCGLCLGAHSLPNQRGAGVSE